MNRIKNRIYRLFSGKNPAKHQLFLLSMFLLLLISLFLLTGCGIKGEAESPLAEINPENQVVVWWHNYRDHREEKLNTLVEEFNNTNEYGIRVLPENPGSYRDITDRLRRTDDDRMPCLIVGYRDLQVSMGLKNRIIDLNTYFYDPLWGFSVEDREDFVDIFTARGIHEEFNSNRWGFPQDRSMEVLYYNKTWLEEMGFEGPPRNPEELEIMARRAKETGGEEVTGLIFRNDASTLASWFFSFGGDIFSHQENKYTFDRRENARALIFIRDLGEAGYARPAGELTMPEQFAKRKALFAQGTSSRLSAYRQWMEEAGNNDRWSVAPVPFTTSLPVQNVYGGDLVMPVTRPESQLAAWIFMKWFSNPEVQARWVEGSCYFPTRLSATEFLTESFHEQYPWWVEAMQLLQYGAFEPGEISYPEAREMLMDAFDRIINGADIEETLDTLNREINYIHREKSDNNS